MKPASTLPRRRFLSQTATLVGSAMAAPFLIPASALGRNGLIPPSERITMGFIGVGTQNRGHLGHFLRQSDVQILARHEASGAVVEQSRLFVN